jgi:ribosome-associated protein
MANKSNLSNSELISEAVIKGMEEKKGLEITLLDLRDIDSAVCDFFVICHASSDTQVKAISESVVDEVRENLKEKPWHIEGMNNAEWVLVDYSNVVAHVFLNEKREFFKLEDLWADAKVTQIESAY